MGFIREREERERERESEGGREGGRERDRERQRESEREGETETEKESCLNRLSRLSSTTLVKLFANKQHITFNIMASFILAFNLVLLLWLHHELPYFRLIFNL